MSALRFLSIVLLGTLLTQSQAGSILWTGYVGDNQWTTQNNWYPNSVPGPNDDVTIDKGVVYVTIPTGVNSIIMGTNVDAPANLTFYHAFAVGAGGLQVKANGNLVVNSGLETVQGTVSIDGTLTFTSGFISGVWTISNRGTGYFPGEGQRNIVAGSLTNQGNLWVDGVVGLNQSAQLVNKNNMVATGTTQFMVFDQTPAFFNSASGSLTINAQIVRFQAPATLGAVTITAGNIEIYNSVSFEQSLTIPAGVSVSALGNANTTFGPISGQGTVIASGASTTFTTLNNIAAVVASGGNTQFTQGATATSVTLSGGNINFGGNVVSTNLNIQGGILSGAGKITGTTVTLSTSGCNLGTTVAIAGSCQVSAPSLLSFNNLGQLIVAPSATLNVQSAFNLTGPMGTYGVLNNGTVNVYGSLLSQNINLLGSGSISLQQSGSLTASTCSVEQDNISLLGTGTFSGSTTSLKIKNITTGTTKYIKGQLGDYSLECPQTCRNIRTKTNGAGAVFSFGLTD